MPIFTSYLIRASFRDGGLYSYSGQPHALSLMPWVTVSSPEGEVWWDREASPWAWVPGSHTVLSAAVAPGRFLAARSLTPDLPILTCLPFPDWTSWPCLPAHVWRELGPWGVGGLCCPWSLADPWTQTNWVPGVLCSWGRKRVSVPAPGWWCPRTFKQMTQWGPPSSLMQGLSISGVIVAIPWGPVSALCWEHWRPGPGLGPTLSLCSLSYKICCWLWPKVRIMYTIKSRCVKSTLYTWKHIMAHRGGINFCSTNMKQDILRI